MLTVVTEDEEIERAIRRDPRFLIRLAVLLVSLVVLTAAGLVFVGKLGIGTRVATGFAEVTEVPPPDAGSAP